jgi:hypothetical protein
MAQFLKAYERNYAVELIPEWAYDVILCINQYRFKKGKS